MEKFRFRLFLFFDRPALINHAEMLRCANVLARHKKDGPVRPVLLICQKITHLSWLLQAETEISFPHKNSIFT
jgi:hypothetical protein